MLWLMEKSVFDQPVKNDRRTYDNMICLLHYVHFKNYYKMKAINLGKQQAIDGDPKAIQQINSTRNLDWPGNKKK